MLNRRNWTAAVSVVLTATLIVGLMIAPVALAAEVKYHGNVESKIFHQRSCRWFDCKNCTKKFSSKDEARKAGYRACKVCKP